jgi:hypothetical protein
VSETGFALAPGAFVRSVDASRDTLDKPRMRLIDVVHHVRRLTGDAFLLEQADAMALI